MKDFPTVFIAFRIVFRGLTNAVPNPRRSNQFDKARKSANGDDKSPLFAKPEKIAKQIGIAGSGAALLSVVVKCVKGFAFGNEDQRVLIEYVVMAIASDAREPQG